jgi:putative ABC transport system permease protein
MFQKLSYNLRMAIDSILQRPLRSFLTSLGIIFGVGAVIAMMAIGQGAQEAIIEQMRILGSDNIIIEPIVEQTEEDLTQEDDKGGEPVRFSPGLTIHDARSIAAVVPGVVDVSPEIVFETSFLYAGRKRSGKLIGVDEAFFTHSSFELAEGKIFTREQLTGAASVCVIGHGVKAKLFAQEEPLGKQIKIGRNWLTIIGVAKERRFSQSSLLELGIRDFDMDIYAPIETVLLRFRNRARVSSEDIRKAAMDQGNEGEEGASPKKKENYHQIDRLVVTMAPGADMYNIADIVRRMLQRRHNGMVDTEVKIPEEVLAQKQKATDIYNYVLISIAALSLLIGGIGIMNIMLASVMERIKEIGVRLSLGATKRDIIIQFLSEAIALSIVGGLLGIAVGFGLSLIIENLSDVKTIVTPFSILLSFTVAFSVGVIFGYFPAKKAASQDPVVSLRYE